MSADVNYFENPSYRLLEYLQDKTDDLYIRICGIEQCLPAKSVGPAVRKGYHLHAVISGKGKLRVGDVKYDVHAGQLFLTVPDREVWYQADSKEPWYYCWTTYEGKNAKRYLESAGFIDGVYVQDCKIDINRFLEVSQEMLRNPKLNLSSELYRRGQAYRFMSLAVESYECQKQKTGIYSNLSMDDYINFAIQYIQNNYANLQIKNVAEYVGLNRTYFTALFKKKMYMSPQEYLMTIRMNHACKLLRETDLPIYVIASSVGYDNALTFSKIFKQKYGVSPNNYRKKADVK